MADAVGRRGRTFVPLALLGVIALVLGGGGRSSALPNLVIFLTAIAVMWWARGDIVALRHRAAASVIFLIFASFLLPLLQLLPVPAAAWSPLPGRETVAQSLGLIGQSDIWRQSSLQPSLTLLSAIGLIPAFTVIGLGASMFDRERRLLIYGIIAIAGVGLALGALQLAVGGTEFDLHPSGAGVRFNGLFANPNSTGLYFVVSLCLLLGLPFDEKPRHHVLAGRIVIVLLLVLGVFFTQSRSSITLLLVPLAVAGVRFGVWSKRNRSMSLRRSAKVGVFGILFVLATVVSVLGQNDRIGQAIGRFDNLEDTRPLIWDDALVSAGVYWPIGSGMGTFDTVHQLHESLEYVRSTRAGRAHNDYLEVAVEAGLPGLLVILGWLGVIGLCIWRRRADWGRQPMILASGAGLLAIALQSAVDYPLRNQALLCLAAFLVVSACIPATRASRLPK